MAEPGGTIAVPLDAGPKPKGGYRPGAGRPKGSKTNAILAPTALEMGDPSWYHKRISELASLMRRNKLDALEAKRMSDFYRSMYHDLTGLELSESARQLLSPVELLRDDKLFEMNRDELLALKDAIDKTEALAAKKKAEWLELIDIALALQEKARTAAILLWVYVGRDTETGGLFTMADVHAAMFEAWYAPGAKHTLVEAPPGNGKSTCFRGKKLWDIANNPSLRCLLLNDSDQKAMKEIALLRMLIKSKPFQALYPHIRVSGRDDSAEQSKRRFTVTRPNTGSREPSFEAAGMLSQINGNGYDRIYIDDPSPPDVANQPGIREAQWFKFTNEIEHRARDPKRWGIDFVCTPWAVDDVAGHIVKEVTDGKRKGWRIRIDEFRIKKDASGGPIPIWPERYGVEYLEDQRDRDPKAYARLFELSATPEEDRIVGTVKYYLRDANDPMLARLDPDNVERHVEKIEQIMAAEQWLSIDPSATSGRKSSMTGITQIALTAHGTAFVVDCWLMREGPAAVQEWLLAALGGPKPREDMSQYRLPHRVDFILFEAQGGIRGQVSLWENYLLRECMKIGKDVTGRLVKLNVSQLNGAVGGQNVGKAQRLKNVASFIENGFLKFPGCLAYNQNINRFEIVASPQESAERLVNQILNFPSGTSDAVDTISQWLIFNEGRLVREQDIVQSSVPPVQFADPLRDAFKESLKRVREPDTKDEHEVFNRWLRSA